MEPEKVESEMVEKPLEKREKVEHKNTSFIKRIKGSNTKKTRNPKPVQEASVDNWFFKNFGLGKLFEEDEFNKMFSRSHSSMK